MKRCPQCEFIYEDDQSLCDMDGVLLVFDSRTLPNVHALSTVSAPLPENRSRRSRMVPAFATLLLMLSIASVYYISTMRNAAPPDFSPASVGTTAPEAPAVIPPAPTPAAEETNKAVEEPPKEEPPRKEHSSPAAAAKPAAEPARKATTSKPAATKTEPEPKKDDSKVGSILKKTGRILKKPFKF
jgi:hypothetical protein